MFRFAPYLFKTLWRHRGRTALTVAGAAVALFVFCFVGAVQQGMDDLHSRQASQRSLIAFQAHKFCPATSHLPQDYDLTIAKLPGVREVVPVQVFTNNCRASLDVVVFYGVPPEKLRAARDFELQGGRWDEFEQHQDAAVVGRAVAHRRGIRLGDRFSIGGYTVTVAAIFSSRDPAEENYIYTHLEFLQRGRGQNRVGTVTQFEVLLQPNADPDALCARIDEALAGGPVEVDTRPKGVFQAKSLGDLVQLISMAHWLAYACVGLVLALVATTSLMSVDDRIGEHAVLQTLGFTWRRIFCLVLAESVVLGTLGGLFGVAGALAVLWSTQLSVGAEAVTVAFSGSPELAIRGILVALGAGTLAGVAPAWHASRSEIVPALRHP